MGVVSAVLKFAGADLMLTEWNTASPGALCSGAEAIAILPLIALVAYTVVSSMKKD